MQALNPLGIGVATGEQCQNRIMFKQFLKAGAMQFCQIDSCRLGGVSENVAVILMAHKFGGQCLQHVHVWMDGLTDGWVGAADQHSSPPHPQM